MKDLKYEDCGMMGFTHMLQSNNMSEDLHLGYTRDLFESHNFVKKPTLKDILSGEEEKMKNKMERKKKKQIGFTFGNYSKILNDEFNYKGFQLTDRGYMVQFEGEEETRFITNNRVFQKIMQKMNFMNTDKDMPIFKSRRFKDTVITSNFNVNEFGFEELEGQKAHLPIFMPFEHIDDRRNERDPKLLSKVLTYYLYLDMFTILQKKVVQRINQLDAIPAHQLQSKTLEIQALQKKKPDLISLKEYILKQ